MTLYVTPERDEALDRLLAGVAATGEAFSIEALRREAGPDADLLFPGGVLDLVEAWADLADRRMVEQAVASDLAAVRSLTERVKRAVLLRFDLVEPNRGQVRRALALLAVPGHAPLAARMTARTTDAIWRAAGDEASGLSWYTKRATLAGVYGAALLYWVAEPRSREDIDAFLSRRLADIGRFGRLRRRLTSFGRR